MKSKRLLSLDVLRGLTVAGMILVNNGYGQSFEMLNHSVWNGMTPCDLVFPFFLFIVGISTYLSLSKFQFRPTPQVLAKIARRTVLLFIIGLAINWLDHAVEGDILCFGHLRVWAVLQRIALCYGLASLFAVTVNHRWTLPTIIALLAVYTVILIVGNGYAEDASNILARTDLSIFGYDHLYHKSPVDPEGLLGTIPSVAHVLIGFYCGKRMVEAQTLHDKLLVYFVAGAVLVIGGYLLSYGLPLNKRIWSPSYVLMTCGLASLLQGLLMYVIDLRGHQGWCLPFKVFGVNPLFLYVGSEVLAIVFGRFSINDAIYNGIHAVVPHLEWASFCYALTFVAICFCIGYVLYRRHIYIKL